MLTLRKVQSERGFMSVESIANALFYLIMIAIVTMVASKVMSSGKMAATASTLSMLRSNIQYVGVNAGDYTDVRVLILPQLIPGLVKPISTVAPPAPDPGTGTLPTGQVVTVNVSQANDPDENGAQIAATDPNIFRMEILAVPPSDCRKLAYYGLGAGYGVMVDDVIMDPAVVAPGTLIGLVETNCGTAAAGVPVVLTSR